MWTVWQSQEKDKMIEALLFVNLIALPKDNYVLQEYVCVILLAIPLDKKEIADKLILALEQSLVRLILYLQKLKIPQIVKLAFVEQGSMSNQVITKLFKKLVGLKNSFTISTIVSTLCAFDENSFYCFHEFLVVFG